MLPASVVSAAGASAACGKNPWFPLGIVLLLAGLESPPRLLIDADLHRGLHSLASPRLLLALGVTFLILGTLDSLADKMPWVERWLTPISTAWRPIAALAVSLLFAGAATSDAVLQPMAVSTTAGLSGAGAALFVATLVAGLAFGFLATIGKLGTRLALTFVPVPGLKVAHSFLDDLFAVSATVLGLALPSSFAVAALGAVYLAVGAIVAPVMLRLAAIQVRIGARAFSLGWRRLLHNQRAPATLPKWAVSPHSTSRDAASNLAFVEAYVYRAPGVGVCRSGFLVFDGGSVRFVTRTLFGARHFAIPQDALVRLGSAETATLHSIVVLWRRRADEPPCETRFHLFPTETTEAVTLVDRGAGLAGLAQVRARSDSARAAFSGGAWLVTAGRYVPAARAGNLKVQALMTLGSALVVGVATAGLVIPIGVGYAASPFKRRFALGLLLSCYLTLCIITTVGLAWPAAIVYGVILNAVALRDLARQALRAHVEGYVDRRAFLPLVCNRVWLPRDRIAPGDHMASDEPDASPDGGWRAVLRLLRAPQHAHA